MEKIKIPFNGTDYFIDESAFAAAITDLQSHFTTSMSGSGAVINLGGNKYNIDATKLTNARNKFTTHLGTIAGEGNKVVINGVEYSVDSIKISDAISELETVLGNLHDPTLEDDSVRLLSSDNLILKDCNGIYLTIKEDK